MRITNPINPERVASIPHIPFVKSDFVTAQKGSKLILKAMPCAMHQSAVPALRHSRRFELKPYARNALINPLTRFGSTGLDSLPPTFSDVPTMNPSAKGM